MEESLDPIDEPSRPEDRVGSIIDEKYRLERVIGAGGMGAVYQATHVLTRRRVAIKLLHAQSTDAKATARLLQEAELASSVRHPGIIEVLDAGFFTDQLPYLVFELLEGKDLGGALEDAPLGMPPAEVTRIGLQLLDALAAAHAQGLVHRDIKPGNIFLARESDSGVRVKVLDFGFAKDVRGSTPRLTATGMIVGSPKYMSPEQARGQAVDARSDVWAVGVLMFRALAGRAPYEEGNHAQIVGAILRAPVPPLAPLRPGLPESLVAVVERALKKSVDERWQSAAEMFAALIAAAPDAGLEPAEIATLAAERAASSRPNTLRPPPSVDAPAPPPPLLASARVEPAESSAESSVSPMESAAPPKTPAAQTPRSGALRPGVLALGGVVLIAAASLYLATRGGHPAAESAAVPAMHTAADAHAEPTPAREDHETNTVPAEAQHDVAALDAGIAAGPADAAAARDGGRTSSVRVLTPAQLARYRLTHPVTTPARRAPARGR